MSSSRVRREDVKLAMEELQSSGVAPTLLKIRSFLKRGSFTTISKHYDELTQKQSTSDIEREAAYKKGFREAEEQFLSERLSWESERLHFERVLTAIEEHQKQTAELLQSQKDSIRRLNATIEDQSAQISKLLETYYRHPTLSDVVYPGN